MPICSRLALWPGAAAGLGASAWVAGAGAGGAAAGVGAGAAAPGLAPSTSALITRPRGPEPCTAGTSPGFTSSPTFTCHLASVPSSMVGDRAGIRTSIVMDSFSGVGPCASARSCRLFGEVGEAGGVGFPVLAVEGLYLELDPVQAV